MFVVVLVGVARRVGSVGTPGIIPMPEDDSRRAGDMVGKGTSTAELLYGSLSGFAFGLISPIAGRKRSTDLEPDFH